MKFVEYNANVRGKNVGDCVKRAICTAYNFSYRKVQSDLSDISRRMNGTGKKVFSYATPLVYCKLLDKYGTVWSKAAINMFDNPVTVAEFADQFDGTYVVECGLFSEKGSSHLVCVTNHTIYDSYNSGSMKVNVVYKVSDENRVETNVAEKVHEIRHCLCSCVERDVVISLGKEDFDWSLEDVKVLVSKDHVTTLAKVTVNGKVPSKRPYFESVVPIPPFVGLTEFLQEYDDITSKRLYSWTLNIRKEFR